VGGVTLSVGYGYTNGNLATVTLPSGQIVTYGYNSNNQVTSVTVGSTTVLSSVTYDPFGPVTGWTWGNSSTSSRTYDQDGRITALPSNPPYPFGSADASRITSYDNTSDSNWLWSYGYDDLDRLTSATRTAESFAWTYDANGNRLTQASGSTDTYTIASTSNRL